MDTARAFRSPELASPVSHGKSLPSRQRRVALVPSLANLPKTFNNLSQNSLMGWTAK